MSKGSWCSSASLTIAAIDGAKLPQVAAMTVAVPAGDRSAVSGVSTAPFRPLAVSVNINMHESRLSR